MDHAIGTLRCSLDESSLGVRVPIRQRRQQVECIRPFPSSPPTKVLVIGDSISRGYTQASVQPTRGYYDAFSSVAQRLLHEQEKITVQIETIAYPGIPLVNPMESEAGEGMAKAIGDRFFHSSPWDATPWVEYDHPSVVPTTKHMTSQLNVSPPLIRRPVQLFHTFLRCLCVIHPFTDFTELQPSVLASISPSVLDCIVKRVEKKLTEDRLHPTSEGHKVLECSVEFGCKW